jgi:crossover junction endodeoxyribonuclease RuvC
MYGECQVTNNVVIAIDGGSKVTGWAVGSLNREGQPQLIDCGFLKPTPSTLEFDERLAWLVTKADDLFAKHQPTVLAIESPYVGYNADTALKLGMVVGSFITIGILHGLGFIKYTPSEWKATLGGGDMSKEMARETLVNVCKYDIPANMPIDTSDAVGVLNHHLLLNRPIEVVG